LKALVTSIEGFEGFDAAASNSVGFCFSAYYCAQSNQSESCVSCCLTELSSAAQSKTNKNIQKIHKIPNNIQGGPN